MPARPRPLAPLAILVVAALLAVACREGGSPAFAAKESASVASPSIAVDAAPAPAPAARMAMVEAPAPAPSASLAGPALAARPAATDASMIIRTGTASVEVDSLEPAVSALQALARGLGGWVANASSSTGAEQVRQATLELKVPAARYDEALGGLRPLGKVERVETTAEDVGEEFVDLSARVANARRLEERLVVLLATRTGKLEDVLLVERELARVREEVERIDGRLRWLRARAATSTLTVTVHEPAPLVGDHPGESVLGAAVRTAWRNAVAVVAGGIALLGTVLPIALLVGGGGLAWRRRRARRASAA